MTVNLKHKRKSRATVFFDLVEQFFSLAHIQCIPYAFDVESESQRLKTIQSVSKCQAAIKVSPFSPSKCQSGNSKCEENV